ncbi:MAG: NAD(P)/FAD-dependent oxidoreductase [Chloroflexi bacterium]|nr:NAD(P)/FAD-dependent oxidoreductase [Chloroflexota bacterium]MCI0577309.1 NAD(P)/FAD-dependent oxidoreductase [Chloroflexota bacterium]MCI0644728.1 NAD(P)/FAD-dependent oxidoreductase [Chloroflexota bacterium]MCI0726701.1 NAD(P)/FAD-dependent oxidoreductase [Chloroflexota bacterium]
MSSLWRDEALAGAAAGLVGGTVSGWALLNQGMMAGPAALLPHLLLSALLGAGFGLIFGHRPESYAAAISSGVLYGLLWWGVGPLTLAPLLAGQGPGWTLVEAGAAFFNLVGYLVYGGLTGFSFYYLAPLLYRRSPAVVAPAAATPRRVVILGGGFGGVSAAQRLEKAAARDQNLQVTLVSQSNYLLFTPMLAEVASGALEPQHISAPVRAACPHTRFLRAAVTAIDTTNQTVCLQAGPGLPLETLAYDHLVLALGSVPHYYDLPGMAEHAFNLKTLEDATRLRNHVLATLERADVEPDPAERQRLLTFVVAGAGFAGTEMIAELFDLVHSVLRYYPHVEPEALRFVLVHSRDRILPELSPALANYSLRKLQARGVEFVLNARVSGATAGAVLLEDGAAIPTQTIIWTAGNQPNPLLAGLPGEHDRRGAVLADETLQVKGLANVWAVGDCAVIPNPYSHGGFYPPTAQHALREGKTAADNILAAFQGRPAKPFRFKTIGLLVALGHRTGAAEIMGRRFSGLLAWLLWRGVYLGKLPGLEKKVRVLLDWLLDIFFPRDIVLTADTAPAAVTDSDHLPYE